MIDSPLQGSSRRWILSLVPYLMVCAAFAQQSLPLPARSPGSSSALIADIDGDPSNGQELAIGTRDGRVHVLRADGSLLWSRDLPNRSCALTNDKDKLYSSPAVGNLFGGSTPYVVIGYGGYKGQGCDGGVAAFRGADGSPAWTFSIRSFSRRERFFAFRHAVVSTPALADTDGDGRLEVGFGALDRSIYLLNSDGKVRWYTQAADTVFSSAAFFDVDGDGSKEMIIGTDISQNLRLKPPTPNGGYLYALRSAPLATSRTRFFPFRDPRLAVWRTEFDQVIQSSPVVAELLPDNPGQEIVVGSGCFFPQGTGERRGRWFKIVAATSGRVLKTIPTSECSPSSAAVADLDNDGLNEVVISTNAPSSGAPSHLLAWKPTTDTALWDLPLQVAGRSDRYGAQFNRSPIIADLDGNGSLEVAVAHAVGIVVVAGADGRPLSCTTSRCQEVLLRIPVTAEGTPAFGDSNGDGIPELYLGGTFRGSGALFRWSSELAQLRSESSSSTPYASPWPMSRGGALRVGRPVEP